MVETPGADTDAIRALVGRVADDATFQNAPRLRQMLLYLCEHASNNPGAAIKESQIGCDIFGRPPNYDTSQDTIVRVQVSQLRRKLQLYFFTAGAGESILIELPKGTYTPVFVPRPGGKPEPDAVLPPIPAVLQAVSPRAKLRWVWVLPVVLAIAGLVYWGRMPGNSTLTRFWRATSLNGYPNTVVISDGTLNILTDPLNRAVELREYLAPDYPKQLIETLPPALREHTGRVAGASYTTLQDAAAMRQLTLLSEHQKMPLSLVFARDYRPARGPANVIFLGHPKANPWVLLYEPRMNFRYQWVSERRIARIVNQQPRAGEQPFYEVAWDTKGYALVACLKPGPEQSTVLILAGADLMSLEAAARTVTDEDALAGLFQRMGLASGAIPPFEALLQTSLLRNAPTASTLVAYRVYAPAR